MSTILKLDDKLINLDKVLLIEREQGVIVGDKDLVTFTFNDTAVTAKASFKTTCDYLQECNANFISLNKDTLVNENNILYISYIEEDRIYKVFTAGGGHYLFTQDTSLKEE